MLKLSNLESIGKPVYKFQNNHSVDFDGVDDFIQLGEPISYTQHTISTWIKVSNSDASKTIIDARDSADDGIRIFLTSAEVVTYSVNTSDITSGSAISVDEWVHIVGTYDGTTQKLYIDGSLVSSATTSQTISTTTNAEIGSRNFSDRANEFLGKIDELAIYDRALTAAEVTEIYRIKYGANLVQNGNFDELGSDLVTNGDFATDSNWTFNSAYWNISGGTANALGVANGSFNQTLAVQSGKTYKIEIASTITSGNGIYAIKLGTTQQIFDNNTSNITAYLVASGDNVAVSIQPGASAFSVSSITVKQVDPNDRFSLDPGWSYGDSKVIGDGTTFNGVIQNSVMTIGKTYKISFTILDYTSGTFRVLPLCKADASDIRYSGNGSYSEIFEAATTQINIQQQLYVGSLTNLMIEEQKYVATNLKLNSGNYKSADPVIVSTKSVDFDGTEEYLEVQANSTFAFGNSNFTLSSWFNLDDLNEGFNYVVAIGNNSSGQQAGIGVTNEKKLFLSAFSSPIVQTSALQIELGKWNNIVASYTGGSTDAVSFYLNGVLIDTLSISLNVQVGKVMIGAHVGETSFFNGQIDEVGIFNTALTSDQVIELYNQGVPGNLSTHSANANLAAYYKMGDGTLDQAPLIADQTNATLGSEIMTDGNFSEGLTHYTTNNVEVTNGVVSFDSSSDWIFQSHGSSFTTGKTYKVTTEGTGNLRFRYGFTGTAGTLQAFTVGTNLYFVADSDTNRIQFYGSSPNSNATLSNVSVKQVNGNPALMINTPTIVTDAPLTKIRNYYRMGDGILDTHPLICDMVEPSLGSDVITNGDFNGNADNWTLSNAVYQQGSGNGEVKLTKPSSGNAVIFQTDLSFQEGQILRYKFKFISFTGSPFIRIDGFSGSNPLNTSTSFAASGGDVDTYIRTDRAGTGVFLYIVGGSVGDTVVIDDVSVQIVNGVPGLMTNMTEADITNDVPS